MLADRYENKGDEKKNGMKQKYNWTEGEWEGIE